ncbi:hypothetical protein BDK92_6806 [Micromonospora pisi]|uniref:PH (Pleckstrin Homology) domain-containing protein n=1 Tax=Micromonospora pisi TaxID=589240 RepID=A0A495JUZ6_9ACTN|nr:hypothetical protein [Micromonospora pisi]RKR92368.1 hypothetical protein BDK92_6806 [Micromonospora pisi]
MALGDVLAARVVPFLEPGEVLQEVFPAQGGITPWLGSGMGVLIALALVRFRIVAVTGDAVVVMEAGGLTYTTPTKVLARLPRDTRIGPVRGIWAKTRIGEEKLYVHWRFHKQVRAADAALVS